MSFYTPKWTYGIQYGFVTPCTLFIPLTNMAFLLRGAVARMAHSFSVNITSRGSQDRPPGDLLKLYVLQIRIINWLVL
ncbi:hypothetical protein F4824DRAFT_505908 [Ustulina deusta]|nr:hypothetical protein F4824DRAFT_505908 [Ustulina deusta]